MLDLSSARQSLSRALIVTRREVRDQLRDWRIIAPVVVLTLFFPLLMNFTAGQAVRFVERYGAPVIGDRLIPFLLMVVGFFPISVSLVIALESFVGEKERHSLEPLLTSPLSDTELYIGKTLAAMLPPLLASYLGIAVYLAGLAWTIGWQPDPVLLIQILALTTIQALVMVSGAVVISAQTTSVRAANLLASFIIIPMAMLVQGESLIMFWAQYRVLWWLILGLLLVTAALVRMGVRLFNREELLGHEIDEINWKLAWATFKSAFVGQGQGNGLGGWYRREVFPTIRKVAVPIMMVAVTLIAAVVIGYGYAPVYRLPLAALDAEDFRRQFGANMAQFDIASPAGTAWILFANVRALAIATGLGIFSFGVLGLILLMAPLALIGYFAGQFAPIGLSAPEFLAAFVLPHGIFEITAAVLAGAAILRLGGSIIAPPPGKTLSEGWLLALADWAKISVGLVLPLLVVAAPVETYITTRLAAALLASLWGG